MIDRIDPKFGSLSSSNDMSPWAMAHGFALDNPYTEFYPLLREAWITAILKRQFKSPDTGATADPRRGLAMVLHLQPKRPVMVKREEEELYARGQALLIRAWGSTASTD